MKKLKQIAGQVKMLMTSNQPAELNDMLWQLICYPPKMPLRLHQQQLMDQAETFFVTVYDEYFTQQPLRINGFKWGDGATKVLITHGWGSKAADFTELITELLQNANLQIIGFDAPANGSSDGDLANLLLFVSAVKAVINETGEPDIVIGHSFGAMANVAALTQLQLAPSLLISIAPFILLQENFIKSMTSLSVPHVAQERFLQDFKSRYNVPASYYNMHDLYTFDKDLNHWLAYDEQDATLPYDYLQVFLTAHPSIQSKDYPGAGHERIIKSAELISDVAALVNGVFESN
jgi:pimeloyl-ACP methyl ester carboxylesterase